MIGSRTDCATGVEVMNKQPLMPRWPRCLAPCPGWNRAGREKQGWERTWRGRTCRSPSSGGVQWALPIAQRLLECGVDVGRVTTLIPAPVTAACESDIWRHRRTAGCRDTSCLVASGWSCLATMPFIATSLFLRHDWLPWAARNMTHCIHLWHIPADAFVDEPAALWRPE